MSKYVIVDKNTGKRLSESVFTGVDAKAEAEKTARDMNLRLCESGNNDGRVPVAKELLEG